MKLLRHRGLMIMNDCHFERFFVFCYPVITNRISGARVEMRKGGIEGILRSVLKSSRGKSVELCRAEGKISKTSSHTFL